MTEGPFDQDATEAQVALPRQVARTSDEMHCPDCGETWMYLLEDAMVVVRASGELVIDWAGELQCSRCTRVVGLEGLVVGPVLRLVP